MATSPAPRMKASELLPLIALTLSAFLLNTSEFVPIGLLTDIAGAFSLSESGAGLMISIYAWAVALLSLPLMLAASRISPKALIVSVLAIFCAGQVASALAPTFELLVALAPRRGGGARSLLVRSVPLRRARRRARALLARHEHDRHRKPRSP